MASPSEKLAASLDVLREFQDRGVMAIRSRDLTRTHRERLTRNGFLQEVMKGWYVPTRPDETASESSAWYASFWDFCAAYLRQLKGTDWCLSPEQSLSLHAENWTVPHQLLVRAARARNNVTALLHGTSLLDVRAALPNGADVVEKRGLRLFSLPRALIECPPRFFRQNPNDCRAALSMVGDALEVLDPLLEGDHSVVAGRLAGAFRNIGRNRLADTILQTMRAAGYDVRETDPFEAQAAITLAARERSPYVNRVRMLWQQMRQPFIELFPPAPGLQANIDDYLKRIDDEYVSDAYHSLSIEGYRVGPELIGRVRGGDWNPAENAGDSELQNALAARGYWQAYQEVRTSIGKVLRSKNPGEVADRDHATWYLRMFGPSVTAGILRPADLAGYRTSQVYIRGSRHVPPGSAAVRDAMPAFFDLLREEAEPSVRAGLGHFIFVYIHPYMDGNGRMGRFLMNTMLASGGYPWTVIPVTARNDYMAALEAASVDQDIVPFAVFLAGLVDMAMRGASPPGTRSV